MVLMPQYNQLAEIHTDYNHNFNKQKFFLQNKRKQVTLNLSSKALITLGLVSRLLTVTLVTLPFDGTNIDVYTGHQQYTNIANAILRISKQSLTAFNTIIRHNTITTEAKGNPDC
jgi:hypothetical protein